MIFVKVWETGKVNLYEYFLSNIYGTGPVAYYAIQYEDKELKTLVPALWKRNIKKYNEKNAWFLQKFDSESLHYYDVTRVIKEYNNQ